MTGSLLTAQQLADRWQIRPSAVYALARDERIPVVELGRYKRFRIEDIETFERAGGTATRVAS